MTVRWIVLVCTLPLVLGQAAPSCVFLPPWGDAIRDCPSCPFYPYGSLLRVNFVPQEAVQSTCPVAATADEMRFYGQFEWEGTASGGAGGNPLRGSVKPWFRTWAPNGTSTVYPLPGFIGAQPVWRWYWDSWWTTTTGTSVIWLSGQYVTWRWMNLNTGAGGVFLELGVDYGAGPCMHLWKGALDVDSPHENNTDWSFDLPHISVTPR